jgi:hypothetical protein
LDTTIAKLQATIVAGEMKSTLIFGQ